RQARASTEAAGARARGAFASLLPQLSATAAYQYTNRSGSSNVVESGAPFYNFFSSNIAATQLLWDFGAAPNRWRAARTQEESAASSEKATLLQVDFNVRSAYFAARANRALVEVARDTLQNVQ